MINPKLSDFTYEQLTLIGKTLIYKKFECQDAIDGWQKYPSLEPMFKSDIEAHEKEMDELETLITQFVHAAAQKRIDMEAVWN